AAGAPRGGSLPAPLRDDAGAKQRRFGLHEQGKRRPRRSGPLLPPHVRGSMARVGAGRRGPAGAGRAGGGEVMPVEGKERTAGIRVRHLWKVFAPKGAWTGRGAPRAGGAPLRELDPQRVAELERRGAVVAVRDVSFEVQPGELFVVMGLSGSGKSTLIRCLLRLVEPTAGTIQCGSYDVTALSSAQLTEFRRRQVAMVFQHYGLLPHRTVLDNVAFGLKLRGVPRKERLEKAREALARVGLAGWEDRYPSALSGGMQQRVGKIGRAHV